MLSIFSKVIQLVIAGPVVNPVGLIPKWVTLYRFYLFIYLFIYLIYLLFIIEFIGVTLVHRTIQVSCIQLNKTSSVHCIVHIEPQVKSLSGPIPPFCPHPSTPTSLSFWLSPHCCLCLCGQLSQLQNHCFASILKSYKYPEVCAHQYTFSHWSLKTYHKYLFPLDSSVNMSAWASFKIQGIIIFFRKWTISWGPQLGWVGHLSISSAEEMRQSGEWGTETEIQSQREVSFYVFSIINPTSHKR